MITLIPFTSEFSVSIANAFDVDMLRLVCIVSFDINCTPTPFVIQASVFEFPVAQVQVTVSPGHTDDLSQAMKGASIDIKLQIKL
jgi:L-aminopeptidase/D-esterase-like protein